ncbi:MAG: protein translocase subunit SecD [Methylophilaceae bacterium]
MNQFSSWKYVVIALTIIFGVTYTIPNFFGESPAIQIMPAKSGGKVEITTLQVIENELKIAGIDPVGAIAEKDNIKLKFQTAEEQIAAKSISENVLGSDFVVALNLISNSPQWLSSLGALPMYLGLDLRGGVHFLMELDLSKVSERKNDGLLSDLRRAMREDKIQYYDSQINGGVIQVKFKQEDDLDKVKDIVRGMGTGRSIFGAGSAKETEAFSFLETENNGEFILQIRQSQYADEDTVSFALKQNLETLHNRVNELGVAEPIIQQQGKDRIVIQLPGVQDTAKAKEILGRTAILEMKMLSDDQSPELIERAENGQAPPGTQLYRDRDGAPMLIKKEIILTGEKIINAGPGVDQMTGQSIVSITLDGSGANIFKQITRENVGKRMALILVEKNSAEVITSPVIKSEIGGGRVQITGMKNAQEATDIALLLRAGSLAAPMEIVEERTVGPSMGKENIARGVNSTIWGFVAIMILMSLYYMTFGLVSVVALSANLLFLVALLSAIQATLTLPGLAAIALTLGMAIDANVLINERIRDEIRNGNTPQASIHMGYEKAWGTILDSNITTLIAGLALFMFGSGPIKGFAVVHVLGILTSMYSAIWVSRSIINYIYGRKRKIESLSIGEIYKIENN